VDCGELYYDVQGGAKPPLTVGQNVTFRIEKQKAYLDDGKNESVITSSEQASPTRSRVPNQTRTREAGPAKFGGPSSFGRVPGARSRAFRDLGDSPS
jgi:hypothetical protein